MILTLLLSKIAPVPIITQQLIRRVSSSKFVNNHQETAQRVLPTKKKNFDEIDHDTLVDCMVNSVIYDKDGILALNKPAGLQVSGKTTGQSLSLVDVLGDIADSLKRPNAVLISAPERESSGIVVLAEDNVTANHLNRDIADATKRSQVKRQYIAVTVGIPEIHQGTQILNVGQEVIGEDLMTVIKHDFTKASMKRQETKRSKIEYNVLDYNHQLNCALIEMWPHKAYKHQLQVHASSMLCCILGDHLYSSRVQSVLGTPILIDPLQAKPTPQKLPYNIRQALKLSVNKVPTVPLHLHYHQLYLKRPDGDLHIIASLPRYFERSTKRLDLKMPS